MNVLFVCTGNTCRSPMAEGYLKSKNLKAVTVRSAGIYADGSPVSENSAAVMEEAGIDISSHTSAPLTADMIKAANRIICMSPAHIEALVCAGVEREKLELLISGIPDPFGGDINDYRACRDLIFSAIDSLFPDIKVRISDMCDADAAQVSRLEKICFSAPWSKNSLKESAKNGTMFWVAEVNGEIVGYMGLDTVLDEGYITNIAVFPEHRNKGVATALLNGAESAGREKELAFITLEVRASNTTAISLYEKLGYKKEGHRKNFYQNPTEDAVIYTKRFVL